MKIHDALSCMKLFVFVVQGSIDILDLEDAKKCHAKSIGYNLEILDICTAKILHN